MFGVCSGVCFLLSGALLDSIFTPGASVGIYIIATPWSNLVMVMSHSFSPLGPSRGGPAGIFSFHSMPALLHLGISTISGGLGVECLQPSLDISGMLHGSSSCITSSGSVHVSGRTCQRSTQTFDSGGTMLDGGSLAPHSSQHVGRCSLAVPPS